MRRAKIVLALTALLVCTSIVASGAEPASAGTPVPMADPQPEMNVTFLEADGTQAIGSTAFRMDDGALDIFIEAFPAESACQWKPKDVTKADIIIQESHGHLTHYDPASVATVQKNTGAYVVGNAQVKSDMLARGVPSSKVVELSPSLGGHVSATVLGVNITAYGMVHTAMATTQVDTYLVEMPNGIRWFHGTCAAASCENTYMTGNEFQDLDVMILDIEHSPATANNNFHPKVLVLDHDYNTNWRQAQLWDDYPQGKITMSHNTTYRYVREGPNVVPELSGGTAAPLEADEDTDFTFRVLYRDVDDVKNRGPDSVKVYYRNGTQAAIMAPMAPESVSNPWTVGNWYAYTTKLMPGEYTYRFEATDRRLGTNGTDWSQTAIIVLPRNKPPQLLEPTFEPEWGREGTVFRFDIMYRDLDNDPPTSAEVYIDDEPHDLQTDSPTGPWNSWVVYYYEATLPVGDSHKFFFLFSDGEDLARYPSASTSPNWLPGPEVLPINHPPTLTTAQATPNEGTRDTQFTVSVFYTDGENAHPTVSLVYIDGVAQVMMGEGGNYAGGVRFTVRTKLGLGSHTLAFVFSDGENEVHLPEVGTIPGPTVVNRVPVALIDSPRDGVRYTPDDYVLFDARASSDEDGDELAYSWKSDIDGELDTEGYFDTTLSEGWHNITLTVDDGHSGTATATVQVQVKAYRPRAHVVEVRTTPESPVERDGVRITAVVGNDGEARADAVEVRILVDGEEVYSDTLSLDIGQTREVSFTWTSTAGDHAIRAVAAGTSVDASVSVRSNGLPVAAPAVTGAGEAGKVRPGDVLQFTPNATDAEGDALSFEWEFGDGSANSTVREPTHSYLEAGTYTVTLRVMDARGGTTTTTLQVVVEKPPKKESPGLGAACALAAMAALAAIAVARRRS